MQPNPPEINAFLLAQMEKNLEPFEDLDLELSVRYPTPNAQETPTLPPEDVLIHLSLDSIRALHCQFVTHYRRVSVDLALAQCDTKEAEDRYTQAGYCVRVSLRSQGFGREELKESIETNDMVQKKLAEYRRSQRKEEYLRAYVRGMERTLDLLKELSFGRVGFHAETKRNDETNPFARHQRP